MKRLYSQPEIAVTEFRSEGIMNLSGKTGFGPNIIVSNNDGDNDYSDIDF